MAWCRQGTGHYLNQFWPPALVHTCTTRPQGVDQPISKTPVRIILWCPTTKMLIKACYLIQPLEQEGGCQKCCIALCSKVFINHFYQMKASSECFNILIYWSKYWVDRLRRTIRRKVQTGIFYQQIYRLCHYILHQVAHIDCSAPSGKQHEPLTGVCVIDESRNSPGCPPWILTTDPKDGGFPNIASEVSWHINTWTKWLPFYRWDFHIHFTEWNLMYVDPNVTEICLKRDKFSDK